MYVSAVVDPDEAKFYDPYEASAYWCVDTQSGFRPRWATGPAGRLLRSDEGAAGSKNETPS